jgi:hypothetical protein
VVAPVTLLAGSRYWVIGSTVGQTNQGSYGVGAHTQSIYSDNGTFWYSNDPNGTGLAGGFLLGAGLVSVALLRRRAS